MSIPTETSSAMRHPGGGDSPSIASLPDFKLYAELLTVAEHDYAVQRFVQCFDDLFSSIYSEGDKKELVLFFSGFCSSFGTYKAPVPHVVRHFSGLVFGTKVVRDFCLELLENFSAEITPLGKHAFERLVYTLATAYADCKSRIAWQTDSGYGAGTVRPEIPVLASVIMDVKSVCATYFENTWLIALVLIARYFKKTSLGKKI